MAGTSRSRKSLGLNARSPGAPGTLGPSQNTQLEFPGACRAAQGRPHREDTRAWASAPLPDPRPHLLLSRTPFFQGQARAALSQAQGFVSDSFRPSVTMTRGSGGEIHPGSSRRDERPGLASVGLMASGKGRQTETERADDRKTRRGEG